MAVGLLEDGARRRGDLDADDRGVDRVADQEDLDGARREGQRRRADRHVPRDERREGERRSRDEGERDPPERPRPRPKSLHEPQRDERREEERRLAGQHGGHEEHPGDEPAAGRFLTSREPPEEQERRGHRQRIADEKRLVQQERPVERRAEPRDRRNGGAEKARGEEVDERHARHAQERLAEADAPEAVAGDPPHGRERVGIERRLVEDVRPTPPPLPGLDRRDPVHPIGVLVHSVAAEDVALQDAARPGPVEGHVGFRPRALVVGDGEPGDHAEVGDADGGGDGEDD